jgi:hypothetical protein
VPFGGCCFSLVTLFLLLPSSYTRYVERAIILEAAIGPKAASLWSFCNARAQLPGLDLQETSFGSTQPLPFGGSATTWMSCIYEVRKRCLLPCFPQSAFCFLRAEAKVDARFFLCHSLQKLPALNIIRQGTPYGYKFQAAARLLQARLGRGAVIVARLTSLVLGLALWLAPHWYPNEPADSSTRADDLFLREGGQQLPTSHQRGIVATSTSALPGRAGSGPLYT